MKKTLSVLAIGNSFSEDGMQYLYDIADNLGYQDIRLGNLYIGGCSLDMHWHQIEETLNDYIYKKNVDGSWVDVPNVGFLHGLQDEPWDIITLQQVSYFAGISESFDPYLDQLITYINQHKTNPSSKFVWHMTWAYETGSDHGGFINYQNDQSIMYQKIVETTKEKILTNSVFTDIIPTGTAIQNMRLTEVGDHLTRDGFHLSFDLGRFVAGLCWFVSLTKASISSLTFRPKGVTKQQLTDAKKAVLAAEEHPFTTMEDTL